MYSRQILSRLTIVATGAVTADKVVGSAGAIAVGKCAGIAENNAAIGVPISVINSGITEAVSGAAVNAGAKLTCDSTGRVVTIDPTTVNLGTVIECIGTAMDTVGAADAVLRVYVHPHTLVGTKAIG